MRGRVLQVEKVWLSAKEAASYFGTSLEYIRSIRESGRIHYYKPYGNKMVFFKKSDLDRFIEKGKQV